MKRSKDQVDEPLGFVNKRIIGIELLRIIAMLMVVILHVLNLGLDYGKIVPYSINWYISWLLSAVCFCAVDIYAIITGFVMINSTFKLQRLITLYAEVFFYSVLSIFLEWVVFPDSVESSDFIKAFLPVLSERFWYFTAYFLMYWFIPLFNWMINKMSFTQLRRLLYKMIILVAILSWISEPLGEKAFGVMGGYSTLWLSILYFVGAGIRLYGFQILSFRKRKYSQKFYILMALISGILVYLSKIIITSLSLKVFAQEILSSLFYSYTSPLVFAEAIFIFASFIDVKLNHPKCFEYIGKMTFGIYLIHLTPFFGKIIWPWFKPYISANPGVFISVILGGALTIFILCLCIEWMRQRLFVICKFYRLSLWIEKQLMKIKQKFYIKVT